MANERVVVLNQSPARLQKVTAKKFLLDETKINHTNKRSLSLPISSCTDSTVPRFSFSCNDDDDSDIRMKEPWTIKTA